MDWNKLWIEDYERNARKRSSEFWDSRAKSFGKSDVAGDYSEQFLSIMHPQPEWSVLDVGCGTGALAVPLASCVSHITAIDFSPAMLEVLETECRERSIENVRAVLGSWEDDWDERGICSHDVVMASRSMNVRDPRTAIEKLTRYAKKRVYIADMVGDGPHDRRLIQAVGREFKARPDYIYTYNILYQIHIFANVGFITLNRDKQYPSREHAYESVSWMIPDMTTAEERKLREFLAAHLVQTETGVRFDYEREVRWAVIWWNVSGEACVDLG